MPMPKQKPGRSKQDYATPWEFIRAVHRFLDIDGFTFDFAASQKNHKADRFWTIKDDSLSKTPKRWAEACAGGWGWLNPPFSRIGPWAKLCMEASVVHGAQIAFLVPAAVGSNWFNDYVHNTAMVYALNGRIAFDPKHPTWGYPKDCMLCLYPSLKSDITPGFDTWRWDE